MSSSLARRWLWWFLGGALTACSGGPISDLPRGLTDDGDTNSEGAGSADAGAAGDGADVATDGTDGSGGSADGGTSMGSVDGGAACSASSDGRPLACYGVYCATTLSELSAGAHAGGACVDSAELGLVCDGAIARTVAQCAQEYALASAPPEIAIGQCARDEAALSAASDDCLGCYVDELLCVVSKCLAVCLGGPAEQCESCRQASCAGEFYACSGLPAP